jgi:hypothetical protein
MIDNKNREELGSDPLFTVFNILTIATLDKTSDKLKVKLSFLRCNYKKLDAQVVIT